MRVTAFGDALRVAVQRSGRSLDELAEVLRERGTPVSASALSYWQNGGNRPERASSLAALATLEEVLGESPGALAALLGPRRPRGRRAVALPPDVRPPNLFWHQPDAVLRALAKLDATRADLADPVKLSQSFTYRVDEHGHEAAIRVHRLIRARRDGLRRFLFLTRCVTLPQPPAVTFTEGCHPGRFRADVPTSTCVFEFLLDRPLRAGETAMVEFGLRYPPGQLDTYVRVEIGRACRDVALRVVFDPRRVPVRCVGHFQPTVDAPLLTTSETGPHEQIQAFQYVTLDPAPGAYGISWQWPGP
ncbi:transcriptional regulator with XRE-family HTH domain [Hamadaea flava]|uniref:XRE family transcriptional regulator n=1 Tax=Hamadaea flava TaxID=1742688 RepID=A0ABV8LUF6_9ACTN|nr:transcriptional regulator with XRE-family HTH domain [Hamadaea flava]